MDRLRNAMPRRTILGMHTLLQTALLRYRSQHPHEDPLYAVFAALDAEGPHAYTRERHEGHFTASAWVVSADGERTLLLHHAKLGRWLQPGGHADGAMDLCAVALKEAQEETGLTGLVVEGGIFDLDRHFIPGRGDVPGHWHYDVRYVVRATQSEAFIANEESLALEWRSITRLADDDAADEPLRRMARKWLARGRS